MPSGTVPDDSQSACLSGALTGHPSPEGRDDIVLATKVYQPMGLGANDRRLSAYHIRRASEASLRRL